MSNTTWLNLAEISKYLKVSKETIRRLIAEEKIPYHRLGRIYLFDTKEVDAALKNCEMT